MKYAIVIPVILLAAACSKNGLVKPDVSQNIGLTEEEMRVTAPEMDTAPVIVDVAGEKKLNFAQYERNTVDEVNKDSTGNKQTLIVYFDFDSSSIKNETSIAVIKDITNRLASDPQLMVRVDGHTDEVSTESYNLALGFRRANAVKRVLELSGVTANRIFVHSFGESKPASTDYQLNRRVEFTFEKRVATL